MDSNKAATLILLLLAVLGVGYGVKQASNNLTWIPCSSCRKG